MRTALDTNIISAVWSDEPSTPAIRKLLTAARQSGALLISPVVYAELLAHPLISEDELMYFLERAGIRLEFAMNDAVWTEAGRRYRAYAIRRRKAAEEQPRRILADFLIGAHAFLHADRLMTIDTARFQRDFPELRLYTLA